MYQVLKILTGLVKWNNHGLTYFKCFTVPTTIYNKIPIIPDYDSVKWQPSFHFQGGNDHEIYSDSRTIGHSVTCPEDTRSQVTATLLGSQWPSVLWYSLLITSVLIFVFFYLSEVSQFLIKSFSFFYSHFSL